MAEVELKFELPKESHGAFRRLAALEGASPSTTRLHALYFDTPEFALRARRMAVRLRRSGRRWTQTLKAGASGAGGLHEREEWEHPRPRAALDLALFAGTPLAAEPDLAGRLEEVFRVEVKRTTWQIEVSPGNRVEVALDRGEVRRGDRAEAVSEVEIESVAGDPLAVFELAERLVGPAAPGAAAVPATPLHPSSVTKAQRGYRLACGEATEPARARQVPLDPAMSPAQAARAIARAAIDQLQANEAGVTAGADPEFLHQYRVALRRLRSGLSVFKDALEPEAQALREELRWIAGLTGPARDWDVFLGSTLPTLAAGYGEKNAARAVRARARKRAAEAHARLREAIASPRYALLLLALARWLATPPVETLVEAEPLADFARRVVKRRHKRLRADAGRLSALTPDERHALRLDAKRLRYALEGLAALFRRKGVEARLDALSEIQEDLGRANDAAVAERLLAQVAPPAALTQFARGWFAGQAHASAHGLERHARRLEGAPRLKRK